MTLTPRSSAPLTHGVKPIVEPETARASKKKETELGEKQKGTHPDMWTIKLRYRSLSRLSHLQALLLVAGLQLHMQFDRIPTPGPAQRGSAACLPRRQRNVCQ